MVRCVVEMQGYNNVVAESMAAESAGGSEACRAAIADGHATIGTDSLATYLCLSIIE